MCKMSKDKHNGTGRGSVLPHKKSGYTQLFGLCFTCVFGKLKLQYKTI